MIYKTSQLYEMYCCSNRRFETINHTLILIEGKGQSQYVFGPKYR